ncbi:hypothetical protein [Massilia sp. Se16.2.3]|uniref:hypothetical protein n=1 Tax=Massilia sp. Se16.2.3 TaxID=2709303 RepID=UPI001602CE7A|nr:hypothetical protein [Massilia sp. Se16.2.3]QNB00112.1 hypothetical protein G4G31_16955 [Massilia sp. Se16.2.3]
MASLPLPDEAVLAKLNAIEQLTAAERLAVQQLYFSPRAELARFSFLFPDLHEAERALIEEADERARWRYFQRSYARFAARTRAVAGHLAGHVAFASDGQPVDDGLAALVLRNLLGDENAALGPREADDGQPPPPMPGPYLAAAPARR